MERTERQKLHYCKEFFTELNEQKIIDLLYPQDLAEIIDVLGRYKSVRYSFIASQEHRALLSDPSNAYWQEGKRIKQLAKFALHYDSPDLLTTLLALEVKVNWSKYFVSFVKEDDEVYSFALSIFTSFPPSVKTLGSLLIWKTYINMLPAAFASVPDDYFMQVEVHNMTKQVVSAMIATHQNRSFLYIKLLWRLLVNSYSDIDGIQLLAKHMDPALFDQPVVRWRDSIEFRGFPCTVMELAKLRGTKYLLSKDLRRQYLRDIAIDYRKELHTYFKKGGFVSNGLIEATWSLDHGLAATMRTLLAKSNFQSEKEDSRDCPPRWWSYQKVHSSTRNHRYSGLAGSGWSSSTLSVYWTYL